MSVKYLKKKNTRMSATNLLISDPVGYVLLHNVVIRA